MEDNNETKSSRATAKAFLASTKETTYLHRGERKLSDFYSECLGPVLSDKVRELLDNHHDEQISLYNELQIARALYGESLKLVQPLFEPRNGQERLTTEIKALILQTVEGASKEVKDLCLAQSKIEKESSDKVSMRVVEIIIFRIMAAINDICGVDNMAIGNEIKRAIDERIRLPLSNKFNPTIQVNLLEAGE